SNNVIRRAELDVVLRVDFGRLCEFEGTDALRAVEKARIRVEIGYALNERLSITPRGQKGAYVKSLAAEFERKARWAHDNRYFANLHQHGVDFASLAKLSVAEVREKYAQLRSSPRVQRLTEQRTAHRQANGIDAALILREALDQAGRRNLAKLLR